MKFQIEIDGKKLIFDSEIKGLKVGEKEYLAGRDGELIYDQTKDLKASEVHLQMTTNTSTLIPVLRILAVPYNKYFDGRGVVESQNDITFYWNKSELAAFYNRFSTDELDYTEREPVIRKAVAFLEKDVKELPLEKEFLTRVLEPCKLIGFYQGFPIFESSTGFAKLQSRLGIHVDPEAIMISTPMDKYEGEVYELAEEISGKTGEEFSRKKNRVIFMKSQKITKLLGLT